MDLKTQQTLQRALQAHQAGQLPEAERLYRQVLQADPRHAQANHNLGLLAVAVGRPALGLPFLQAALQADPRQAQHWLVFIDALQRAGEIDVARRVLADAQRAGVRGDALDRLAVQLTPAAAAFNQGNALAAQGQLAEAEACYRRAIQADPRHAGAQANLGAVLLDQGRAADAEAPLRQALQCVPNRAGPHNTLAAVLLALGRLADAEASARQALALQPDLAKAHANLGVILQAQGRLAEAETACRQAIALQPQLLGARDNLAVVLLHQGRLIDAEACCRETLLLAPDHAGAHLNLATTLLDLGQVAPAQASCRQALALAPDDSVARSNLLLMLNYGSDLSPQALLQEAQDYGQRVARQVRRRFDRWACSVAPQRLRLGFVSGDLRSHPVGYFLQALLSQIDRTRFDLVAYPTQWHDDEQTERLRPGFDHWVPIAALDDDAAAARIQADGVHILLDLAGHTAHNRLPLFARKPALLQGAWLGYFASTGLAEMDFVLGDPQVTPPHEEHHFCERIRRLPETYFCFAPPQVDLPVGPLPALAAGHITFGCFSTLPKLTDAVLALWARVLQALPASRLLLKNKQLADAQVAQGLLQRLAAFGVAAARVQLEGPSPRHDYLQAYQRVDVALDSFPFPAGTTSVEALWMGVPTLTRRGQCFIGHNGETIAVNAGQAGWIADDDEDYVRKAVQLTSDLRALAALRAGLRSQVLASPLFDAPRFARHFEAAMTALWTERQTGATPPSASAPHPPSAPRR